MKHKKLKKSIKSKIFSNNYILYLGIKSINIFLNNIINFLRILWYIILKNCFDFIVDKINLVRLIKNLLNILINF